MTSFFGNLKPLRAALTAGLLIAHAQLAVADTNSNVLAAYNRTAQVPAPRFNPNAPASTATVIDRNIQPANFDATTPTNTSPPEDRRSLAPPTRAQIAAPGQALTSKARNAPSFVLPKIESFTTASAGLAIVVGLFFVCVWLLRRSGPKPTSPLPTEAVAVLGRVPLAARNFAHLLQVGNKLVLVAITPDGVSPITEITDPLEVQRLLGLCLRNNKQSTSAEFHDVLKHLTKEPASGFLGNEAAASYASHSR